MNQTLALVSGVLFIIGFVPYVIAIIRGRTVPTRSTWIAWTVIDVIAVVTMRLEDALNLQIVCATIGASIVTALSFRRGEPGWSPLDKACLIGAGIGVALWLTSGDPLIALAASQISGLIGAVPLVVSAWRDPRREDPIGLAFFGASALCMLFALDEWTLAKSMQPLQFAVVTFTVNVILHTRPKSRAE